MSGVMSEEKPATLHISESGEDVKLEMTPTPPEQPDTPVQGSVGTGNRDPQGINQHVKVQFDEIFGEPDKEIYSFDKVWTLGSLVFSQTKLWCYRITSLICVLPLAVCWGCSFACVSFCSVWCCMPCFRCQQIKCVFFKNCWKLYIDSCVAPFWAAIGSVFSGIRVRQAHVKE